MNYTVYVLRYNNYYNRQFKYQPDIQAYEEDGATIIATIDKANFKPGDDITTSLVAPYRPVDWGSPDYVYVVGQEDYQSRWFVMETKRTREGQYELLLQRDVLADFHDNFLRAPALIRRAMPQYNNPLIFKREGNTYNQIKTNQISLKDKSNVPWIVGYVAKNIENTPISVPAKTYPISGEYARLSDYPYYQYNASNPYKLSYTDLVFSIWANMGRGVNYQITIDQNGNPINAPLNQDRQVFVEGFTNNTAAGQLQALGYRLAANQDANKVIGYASSAFATAAGANLISISNDYTGVSRTGDLISSEDGKYIQIDDYVYKVSVEYETTEWLEGNTDSGLNQAFDNLVAQFPSAVFSTTTGEGRIYYRANVAYTNLERIATSSVSVEINSSHNKLDDGPYDIFCIPYGSITFDDTSTDKDIGVRIAAKIAEDLDANCYDVQILPYAPLPDNYFGNFSFVDTTKLTEGMDFNYIKSGDDNVGLVFWLNGSQLKKQIKQSISCPTDAVKLRVESETSLWRLCSANYNSIYEFSPYMNYGVEKFEISIGLKPYNPYIKICPYFKGYNGDNFVDSRGLILTGDFSMTRTTDAWTQYELNNKNYQAMFDRQVESMELQNKWSKVSDIASAITGAATAGAGVGMVSHSFGASVPGAFGIGGAAGAISGVAGGVDIAAKEQIRQDQLSLYRDNFRLQNENIQARPDTLTKVSALNPDNLIFPQLEYYTATSLEKDALTNAILYRSCPIDVISTVEAYQWPKPTFISAEVIRFEGLQEDTHIANEINKELSMGVYI